MSMSDDEILEMMIENEKLKDALEKIAKFDPSEKNGYRNEWEDAEAFSDCQEIARAALEKLKEN